LAPKILAVPRQEPEGLNIGQGPVALSDKERSKNRGNAKKKKRRKRKEKKKKKRRKRKKYILINDERDSTG
jgi:hypothetical protein